MNNNNVIQLAQETTLVFAPNEINMLLAGLNELPRKMCNELVIKIERQLINQQPTNGKEAETELIKN